jgi:hypothetical protein
MLHGLHKTIFFALTLLSSISPLHGMELSTIRNKIPTALHLAAKEGNIEKITALLNNGADINSTECDFNNTPLHVATWFGHAHCVTFLIARGARFDIPNVHGSTPTHIAAWKNEPTCLQKLIENGTLIGTKNTTGTGNTELYLAAKAGSTECLNILLRYNNKKEYLELTCSGDNSTAIQAAAGRQNPQCYWNLVLAGANYTKKISERNLLKTSSQTIYGNNSLKNFLHIIECCGKNNPPRFDGLYDSCWLCKKNFQHNDVAVTIQKCLEAFHADCFQDYCVNYFIEKNKDIPSIIELKKDKSYKEFAHDLKTHPFGSIDLADTCPACKTTFNPQTNLKYSVFLQ